MALLGIETSCDETAAAVISDQGEILSSIVRSQQQLHAPFLGVVPEVASRSHCTTMLPIIDAALKSAGIDYPQLSAVAVTTGPGLRGSLLVGLVTAKALAYGLQLPLIGVDHLEAHIAAAFLGEAEPRFPLLALVISGGHTMLCFLTRFGEMEIVGNTLDDAVGEAYDKVATFLDLGYPGGPIIDRLAEEYAGDLIELPIPMQRSGDLNFSFSGLKTAVVQFCRAYPKEVGEHKDKIAASFQRAAVTSLMQKLLRAGELYPQVQQIIVCGGVSCNRALRRALREQPVFRQRPLLLPEPQYCTDNAAMIAKLGHYYFKRENFTPLDVSPYTSASHSPVCHRRTDISPMA